VPKRKAPLLKSFWRWFCLGQWFSKESHLVHKGRNFNPWEGICSREELGRKSCGWKTQAFIISLL